MKKAGLPEDCVAIVENTNRESVLQLVKLKEYIDVIIPRGGLQLIRFVEENSLIPVIRHDMGICHTYVDEFANTDMAIEHMLQCQGTTAGSLQCHGNPAGP